VSIIDAHPPTTTTIVRVIIKQTVRCVLGIKSGCRGTYGAQGRSQRKKALG